LLQQKGSAAQTHAAHVVLSAQPADPVLLQHELAGLFTQLSWVHALPSLQFLGGLLHAIPGVSPHWHWAPQVLLAPCTQRLSQEVLQQNPSKLHTQAWHAALSAQPGPEVCVQQALG
jgi:hypothetical protein